MSESFCSVTTRSNLSSVLRKYQGNIRFDRASRTNAYSIHRRKILPIAQRPNEALVTLKGTRFSVLPIDGFSRNRVWSIREHDASSRTNDRCEPVERKAFLYKAFILCRTLRCFNFTFADRVAVNEPRGKLVKHFAVSFGLSCRDFTVGFLPTEANDYAK